MPTSSAAAATTSAISASVDVPPPPKLATALMCGAGVSELVEAIAAFRAHSGAAQAERRKTRSEYRLRELVSHRFMDHLERYVLAKGELGAMVDRVAARDIDPYTAANELLTRAGLKAGPYKSGTTGPDGSGTAGPAGRASHLPEEPSCSTANKASAIRSSSSATLST